jgi:hypothetical protein
VRATAVNRSDTIATPDPVKLAEVIERYFPLWFARFLVQAVILGAALGAVGFGLKLFFADFIGAIVWPFLARNFGLGHGAISLDNIEAIIVVLVASIVILVLVFLVAAYAFVRAFHRRVVPQRLVDQLAEHRSEGISILNDRPADAHDVQRWHSRWTGWSQTVAAFLGGKFTRAERLSFERLGVIAETRFGTLAVTPEHGHYLMQLARQLTILELLIQRHLERR